MSEANRNTYANASAAKAPPLRPGSSDYHFEKGAWRYHDTYFGGRRFIGNEVVYFDSRPVWGMVYYGRGLEEGQSEEYFDKALRPALMQESGDIIPVRGPAKFVNGDFEYGFEVTGSLRDFLGTEKILRSGVEIYRCDVAGGLVQK